MGTSVKIADTDCLVCFYNRLTLTTIKNILFLLLLLIGNYCFSQLKSDSLLGKIDPQKWSATVEREVSKLEKKIISKSQKTLDRLQKQEEKIYRLKLKTSDSLEAKLKLSEIKSKYKELKEKLTAPLSRKSNIYIPQLDTLTTAFKFLDQEGLSSNIKDALSKVQSLQGKMHQAEEIKKFMHERKDQIKNQLTNLGVVKELKKINKEVYYYGEQLKEYKSLLKDKSRRQKKALEVLSKTKLFKDFMKKNSMLASLFRMPGDVNDPNYTASLAGLQTRSQVNTLIQNQISAGGPGAQQQFSENLQAAQTQIQQLKNKLNKWGNGSSDDIMPEGFKPNDQKTKSFLQRLELGSSVQTQGARYMFPITSDLGLSLGYKLNDKSVIGVGAAYKLGWGTGWNNIRITHQGLGLRSYMDWKLKGSFWVSGGYEQNFRPALNGVQIPSPFGGSRMAAAWQQSGLIGISKVVSVKSKLFKKTKAQLLWDFLSYQQVPRTQAIVFRIGYNLK